MAVSTDITDKLHLKKTTMQVKSILRKREIKGNIFRWTIPNFNNLKKNVEYGNKSDKQKSMFTIVKKSSSYEVTICIDNYEMGVKCAVLYKDSICSVGVIANKIDEGVYKVNFQNRIIKTPSNLHLQMNKVVLIFRFSEIEIGTISVQPTTITDACPNFMKMNIERMLQRVSRCLSPDFVIHGKEECFEVHKAILAARSTYFRDYIKDNCKDGETGEINLNLTSNAMYNLLSFMYTGRIHYTMGYFFELCDLLHWLGVFKSKTVRKKSWQDKLACTANTSKVI